MCRCSQKQNSTLPVIKTESRWSHLPELAASIWMGCLRSLAFPATWESKAGALV